MTYMYLLFFDRRGVSFKPFPGYISWVIRSLTLITFIYTFDVCHIKTKNIAYTRYFPNKNTILV